MHGCRVQRGDGATAPHELLHGMRCPSPQQNWFKIFDTNISNSKMNTKVHVYIQYNNSLLHKRRVGKMFFFLKKKLANKLLIPLTLRLFYYFMRNNKSCKNSIYIKYCTLANLIINALNNFFFSKIHSFRSNKTHFQIY